MDRTFGVKDFVLFSLIGVVIVLVVLAMLQFDRQWDEVQNIKQKLEQQASDLRSIGQQISRGVTVGGGGAPTTAPLQNLAAAQQRVLAARQKPDFAEGDWLVTGLSANFTSLTPIISTDGYAADLQSNVIESLCARDPVSLQWQGLLADSWTTDDTSAKWEAYAASRRAVPLTEVEIAKEKAYPAAGDDAAKKAYVDRRLKEGRTEDSIGAEPECPPAITFTFKLRPNAAFSDGAPVTADDVVWTFDFTMNPAVDAPRERAYFSRIRAVKKINEREVAFVFSVPYFKSFELAGGFGVLPKHFYEKYTPQQFNQSTGLLMGSGPYMMEDPTAWKPGRPAELVRNPRYWGVAPAFAKLVFRQFTNAVALETGFTNGEFDSFECKPEQYLSLKNNPAVASRTQNYEYQSAVGAYRYIGWNQARNGKPTKFADKRVRQAMTLLSDQKRLLSDVMLGLAVPAIGPFNPASRQSDTTLKPWAYDPDHAARLLADAGWADKNNSGILSNAAGENFEFKLTYPSGIPNYEKMVLLLKDMYARAKIRLIPDPQEFSVFRDRLKNREFDAITLAWGASIEGDIYQMFHSSQMVDGGDNCMSYKNDELDKKIEQARRTVDEPLRMKLWNECHTILYEDQPYTFLFFPKTLVLLDARIANVQKLPLGLNGDSEWYVPRAKQRWTK
ncbi:MAG TPA: ABC transporter substrate-binding protein [Tepidisphaeraceae bacterium]|jgi:peptide/nickel transport system substrate-binding protein